MTCTFKGSILTALIGFFSHMHSLMIRKMSSLLNMASYENKLLDFISERFYTFLKGSFIYLKDRGGERGREEMREGK